MFMNKEAMLKLKGIHLAPYIQLATALIGMPRNCGGNMFRHQMDTLGILIDYGYTDSVLLKASVIHDLLEDIPSQDVNQILSIDFESYEVYKLVLEVSCRETETKGEFLTRVRQTGSHNAKVLKCADRISNMISLGLVMDAEFVKRYIEETAQYVFPIALETNLDMLRELTDLVASRTELLNRLSCMADPVR